MIRIRNRNPWPRVFSAFAIGLGAGAALGFSSRRNRAKTLATTFVAPPRMASTR